MAFKIIGQLYKVSPQIQVTQTFAKREFVVFVENNYNEKNSDWLQFEISNQNMNNLDQIPLGAMVDVNFILQGRRYERKDGSGEGFITTAKAINVFAHQQQPQPAQQPIAQQPLQQPAFQHYHHPQPAYQQYQQPQNAQQQPQDVLPF